jgi:hypothetical protein
MSDWLAYEFSGRNPKYRFDLKAALSKIAFRIAFPGPSFQGRAFFYREIAGLPPQVCEQVFKTCGA